MLDIQSANVCIDNLTLTVNTENDCSKIIGTADCDINVDTDSGTSVDKHTFTESLTSDSLNETSPSPDTCCTVEDSRTDACDCPCITCQVPVTSAIVAAILLKVLPGKDYILSKNCINSSVLPGGLTSALHE